jgi:hypothetical protein
MEYKWVKVFGDALKPSWMPGSRCHAPIVRCVYQLRVVETLWVRNAMHGGLAPCNVAQCRGKCLSFRVWRCVNFVTHYVSCFVYPYEYFREWNGRNLKWQEGVWKLRGWQLISCCCCCIRNWIWPRLRRAKILITNPSACTQKSTLTYALRRAKILITNPSACTHKSTQTYALHRARILITNQSTYTHICTWASTNTQTYSSRAATFPWAADSFSVGQGNYLILCNF